MSRSVWIEGYEGRYKIYEDGRVMSFLHGKEKFLKLWPSLRGYLQCTLITGGKTKCFTVHRLVAKHFVPGCKPGLQVNHKNSDSHDNRSENLEWVTPRENLEHQFLHDPKRKIRPVIGTNINGESIRFESVYAAAKSTNGGYGNIRACLTGRLESCKGYRWRYA